jgi:hypothetical protein
VAIPIRAEPKCCAPDDDDAQCKGSNIALCFGYVALYFGSMSNERSPSLRHRKLQRFGSRERRGLFMSSIITMPALVMLLPFGKAVNPMIVQSLW